MKSLRSLVDPFYEAYAVAAARSQWTKFVDTGRGQRVNHFLGATLLMTHYYI